MTHPLLPPNLYTFAPVRSHPSARQMVETLIEVIAAPKKKPRNPSKERKTRVIAKRR
jgi:hypothetical protein